jgi:Tetratricopeptide repeat
MWSGSGQQAAVAGELVEWWEDIYERGIGSQVVLLEVPRGWGRTTVLDRLAVVTGGDDGPVALVVRIAGRELPDVMGVQAVVLRECLIAEGARRRVAELLGLDRLDGGLQLGLGVGSLFASGMLGALQDETRVLGPGHPVTLTTYANVAFWTGQCGNITAALRLSRELLPVRERALGTDHPEVLGLRNNIAYRTAECGQVADGLRLFREVLTDRARVQGADHPETLATRNSIAFWTGQDGNKGKALELFNGLLSDEERALGRDHPYTLITRENIASTTGECGNASEALRLFQELLSDQERPCWATKLITGPRPVQ